MKFYTFVQNNTRGDWHFSAVDGITHVVIVQAEDFGFANFRARRIGLYFDGADDCSCCGERWTSHESESDATDFPTVYDQGISEWMTSWHFSKWMAPDLPEVFVHLVGGGFSGFVYGEHGRYRMTERYEVEGS